MSEPPHELDKAWASTAKVLLGGDVPQLGQVAGWLQTQKQPMGKGRSALSGQEVDFPSQEYGSDAKAVRFSEVGRLSMPALSINDVKDFDSLVQSVSETTTYCGDVVLGNSASITSSTDVSDSHFVAHSARVSKSEYAAYCTIVKECKYLFGCNVASYNTHCIRGHQFTYNARCLEVCLTTGSSDCYYTQNVAGGQDCFFSFNQRNSRQVIGNLQLPKAEYQKIKSALLEQMRSILNQKKALPTMAGVLAGCEPREAIRSLGKVSDYQVPPDAKEEGKSRMEESFRQTSAVVLGKALGGGLDAYAGWLSAHTYPVVEIPSALGSGPMACPSYENLKAEPKGVLVNFAESMKLAYALKLTKEDAENLTFENAPKLLSKIALTTQQFFGGNSSNSIACPITLDATDVYKVHGAVRCKNSAFSTWPNGSEAVFGCAFAMDSAYCINCYNSFNLKRCFECDTCRDCSDCYFSHNIENCAECMFCFNVKAKRYAIGNVEVGKEKYMQTKKMVLAELAARLEKDKMLGLSIYNLA